MIVSLLSGVLVSGSCGYASDVDSDSACPDGLGSVNGTCPDSADSEERKERKRERADRKRQERKAKERERRECQKNYDNRCELRGFPRPKPKPQPSPWPQPSPESQTQSVWRCSYSETWNDNWHDDMLCTNGLRSERPYLLPNDTYITPDEIMNEGLRYEDYLNSTP